MEKRSELHAGYPTKPGPPGNNQDSSNLFTVYRPSPTPDDNFYSYRTPFLGRFGCSKLNLPSRNLKITFFMSKLTCCKKGLNWGPGEAPDPGGLHGQPGHAPLRHGLTAGAPARGQRDRPPKPPASSSSSSSSGKFPSGANLQPGAGRLGTASPPYRKGKGIFLPLVCCCRVSCVPASLPSRKAAALQEQKAVGRGDTCVPPEGGKGSKP